MALKRLQQWCLQRRRLVMEALSLLTLLSMLGIST